MNDTSPDPSPDMRQEKADRILFEELYRTNRGKIYRLAYGMVDNTADAEDLLQEIFCSAFRAMERFRQNGKASISTWLYRIGINASISFLRKKHRKKRGIPEPLEKYLHLVTAEDSAPQSAMEKKEMEIRFKNSLHRLSVRQRTIIILRYYNGLKINEIAGHMRCSEGTVKKHIFRGLARLRRYLEPFYDKENHHEL